MFCHLENLVVLNALGWLGGFGWFLVGGFGIGRGYFSRFSAKMPFLREPVVLPWSLTFDQDLFSG
jgi:hypothetical protein